MAGGYGGYGVFPTTGVWWDLNTCPVPDYVNPGLVRASIESALRKFYGPRPVTIFAVGNLQYISPDLLKTISSSGIFLRHVPCRGASINWLVHVWRRRNKPPSEILLISGDRSWFNYCIRNSGYTLLRAFPKHVPSFLDYQDLPVKEGDWPCMKEWDWETLLKDNSEYVGRSMLINHKDEPALFCNLCSISIPNVEDFIKHLKSEEHMKELFDLVPSDENNNDRPFKLCTYCNYPAYDDFNMSIHTNSDEHQQKTNLPPFVHQPTPTRAKDCHS